MLPLPYIRNVSQYAGNEYYPAEGENQVTKQPKAQSEMTDAENRFQRKQAVVR